MGTRLEVVVTAPDTNDAWRAAESAIRAVDAVEERLSTWLADSEISRINRAEVGHWVEISSETVKDLETALWWRRETQDAFDPGIGALVDAWAGGGSGRLPGPLLAGSNADNLQIDDLRVRRAHRHFKLTAGAFGKGVALRDAAARALEAGAGCITLNFGGQVMRAGRCGELLVSIADPRDRASEAMVVPMVVGSLATSGNSERGRTVGGRRVGHIIDPRTGYPSPFKGSVTVFAEDPVTADCLSTALFVMGPEVGSAWLGSHTVVEIEALWIGAGGEVEMVTPGFWPSWEVRRDWSRR